MAHGAENDQYAEIFDEGHSGKEHSVHQRLRANSTIMELKKILGADFPPGPRKPLRIRNWIWADTCVLEQRSG